MVLRDPPEVKQFAKRGPPHGPMALMRQVVAQELLDPVPTRRAAGRVLTHDQLLQRVWGLTNSGGSGPVRTVVKNLRRKLGDDADNPAYIFTKRRVGYWMEKGETGEEQLA